MLEILPGEGDLAKLASLGRFPAALWTNSTSIRTGNQRDRCVSWCNRQWLSGRDNLHPNQPQQRCGT